MLKGDAVPYEDTAFDEARARRYAVKVARHLTDARVPDRGPRKAFRSVEEVTEKIGWFRTQTRSVERVDDGGTPRFWVVKIHFWESSEWCETINGAAKVLAFSEGVGILLTPDGKLLSARGSGVSRDGSDWTYEEIRPAESGDLLWMDNREGHWRSVKPHRGQHWREEWQRNNRPGVHAKGVGISLALKRML